MTPSNSNYSCSNDHHIIYASRILSAAAKCCYPLLKKGCWLPTTPFPSCQQSLSSSLMSLIPPPRHACPAFPPRS